MPPNSAIGIILEKSVIASCDAAKELTKTSDLPPDRKPRPALFEWPTLLLFAGVYGGWTLGIIFHELVPWWLLLPALALLTTLHSSLQHEALHGHPTRNARLNECLAGFPLGLYIPYRRFKRLHLRHHCDENLTDPYDDPESFYLARRDWTHLPAFVRWLLRANNTLLGRLAIGPALALFAFYRKELSLLSTTSSAGRCVLKAWAFHGIGLIGVGTVLMVNGFPLWLYVAGVAYPAMSLLMLRTYAEHQAAEGVGSRTAIVEASAFFALLYLNNNLHFVHHRFPTAAWYALPQLYRTHYAVLNAENDHYKIPGYGALFARYLVRAKEPVAHPLRRTKPAILQTSTPTPELTKVSKPVPIRAT